MEDTESDEPRLIDIIDLLWKGRWRIIIATILSLVIGAGVYFLLPRTYKSDAEITLISDPSFARFLSLNAAGIFPYTPASLFDQFGRFLRDDDALISAARDTKVVDPAGRSPERYQLALRKFIGSIDFSTNFDIAKNQNPRQFLRMEVAAQGDARLYQFMKTVLERTSVGLAKAIRSETQSRIDDDRQKKLAEIKKIEVQIDARRTRVEKQKSDEMERLSADAKIARYLNIAKPLQLQALSVQGASAQVYTADTPAYLRGYLALEEQIQILKDRKDNEPYIADLRDLQQQIYILENDPETTRFTALLNGTHLTEKDGPQLVNFSIEAAVPVKIFPTVSVFGPAFLLLGLLIGSGIVFLEAAYRKRRRDTGV